MRPAGRRRISRSAGSVAWSLQPQLLRPRGLGRDLDREESLAGDGGEPGAAAGVGDGPDRRAHRLGEDVIGPLCLEVERLDHGASDRPAVGPHDPESGVARRAQGQVDGPRLAQEAASWALAVAIQWPGA